jgi:hypothetical protein
VSKGLAFSVLSIIILVMVMAAIIIVFFMSRTGYSEAIAAQINKTLSISLP